jgi:hypothetical protein
MGFYGAHQPVQQNMWSMQVEELLKVDESE